ncbi:DUF3243 family protein [Priestia megaterium]|uniref:DUF3243 family protein n=1 Tax=Priestia megaterium TaxID=1404 RepID=UPI0020D2277D|nr:DUF3243 family protein [Priestia megaterium]MEE3894473.1 DUF3243 family protein [Priestia megaterium]
MNDSQLALVAKKIADYLPTHEEQQNEEQYLLQGLWKLETRKNSINLLICTSSFRIPDIHTRKRHLLLNF